MRRLLLPVLVPLLGFWLWAIALLGATTGQGKKYAAEQLTKNKMKFFGAFEALVGGATGVELTSETAIAGSTFTITGAKAAGWTNRRVVWFNKLPAATTNPVAGRPYYIKGEATNNFELCEEPGGTAIKVEGAALKANSETLLSLLVEVTGGVTQPRTETTFAGIAEGSEDATARKVKIPAGKTIRYIGWWEVKEATGESAVNELLFAVEKLTTAEAFGEEGEFTLTTDKLTGLTTQANT